jgi:hypothetical protein
MGIIGFLLYLGGICAIIMGVIGVGVGLFTGDYASAGHSALFIVGGLVSGTIGVSILE